MTDLKRAEKLRDEYLGQFPAVRNWLEGGTPKTIEDAVDIGLRHRNPRARPVDYLLHWLQITRLFARATHDDSWGELEKNMGIVIRRLVMAERQVKALEARVRQLEAELKEAYED